MPPMTRFPVTLLAAAWPARAGVLVAGVVAVVSVIGSAARTVVLPDGRTPRMARVTFSVARAAGVGIGRLMRSPQRRHLVMSGVPAAALLAMPLVWLGGALAGFTAIFWGLHPESLRGAYVSSGSALFTLGFKTYPDLPSETVAFVAAAVAISILALLVVTYLPTLYGVYSRREALTTAFETSAGDPPEAAEMIVRYHVLAGLDRLSAVWMEWRDWFNESRETHTALPMVVLFRSAKPHRSWVVTVAAVLDSAALLVSCVDEPYDPVAALTIRSGYLCLRDIADPHGISYDPDPSPTDAIGISRADFDLSYDKLASAGLPMHARERAWVAFAGWRVNYDSLVADLAALVSVDVPGLTKRPAEPRA
jgi:hypothetical protein